MRESGLVIFSQFSVFSLFSLALGIDSRLASDALESALFPAVMAMDEKAAMEFKTSLENEVSADAACFMAD